MSTYKPLQVVVSLGSQMGYVSKRSRPAPLKTSGAEHTQAFLRSQELFIMDLK